MSMIKQKLSQKMLQKLSPQQIQVMKLLQIPTATLEQRIKEELEANPALDEGENRDELFDLNDEISEDSLRESNNEEYESGEQESESADLMDTEFESSSSDFELDDYISDYIDEDPISYQSRYNDGEEERTLPIAFENSFHDFLDTQLGMLNLQDPRKIRIAKQIIGSIDDDGYLRREPLAIIDDLLFSENIDTSEEEVDSLLAKIQLFDPPGIGARDLQECLLIQINTYKKKNPDSRISVETIDRARCIVTKYFNEFSKKHFDKLKKYVNLSEAELKETMDFILKLNPKPASGYVPQHGSSSGGNYIIPDFIIFNRDGELELQLNSKNAPELRINEQYKNILHGYKERTGKKRISHKDKEAIQFIKQKIDSAKWFIDAIKQRQHTMYQTMYTIMQYQYDYFLSGDESKLKPMILKDIADITGLDISTVSRVANSKFVQTEFGTKRLKDFFSESMTTQDGDEVSTLEVKNILSEIITAEHKRKPHSDEKLRDLLEKKGYNIARRTVAKYREQLNIPVARLRKQL
ncbi:MAG TPA: RNA polymerase factor sigma-54 [Saprospiraceae bacterium]|nr:RNA polymerase factor sigma-54 [Saprospiraceae bacterium]HRV84321.1 RNA polymerase factor sigma-54 [Saprospiraceae bacterium]